MPNQYQYQDRLPFSCGSFRTLSQVFQSPIAGNMYERPQLAHLLQVFRDICLLCFCLMSWLYYITAGPAGVAKRLQTFVLDIVESWTPSQNFNHFLFHIIVDSFVVACLPSFSFAYIFACTAVGESKTHRAFHAESGVGPLCHTGGLGVV